MNKSEIAEKAAREIHGNCLGCTETTVDPLCRGLIKHDAAIVERAIAESQATQHHVHCSAVQDSPLGSEGCSCLKLREVMSVERKRPEGDSRFRTPDETGDASVKTRAELGDGEPSLQTLIDRITPENIHGESGAAQEVSPVGSVQKITGPERPRCPRCGAETTCLSCGTKAEGDTRELKAALKKAARNLYEASELLRDKGSDLASAVYDSSMEALAAAEKLLG